MIDLKELRKTAEEFLRQDMSHMGIKLEDVIELCKRLESAERKIKRYGKGSEALCSAFGVKG